ncbi:MAG: hypothetical protein EBR82_43190 [Caulobacteraceae bacterium]|nr:hypothetical protein [Caulobacteraceae bacterium]
MKSYIAPRWLAWLLKKFGFLAITLPPLGVFFVNQWDEKSALYKHELVHWEQYKKMGLINFYLTYLWYQVRYGYQNNPMEIEARQ